MKIEEEAEKTEEIKCQLVEVVERLNLHVFNEELSNISLIANFKKKNFVFHFENGAFHFGLGIFDLHGAGLCLAVFHEMVHAINHKKGLLDVGRNDYHNKLFLEESLARGVFVVKHKSRGWSIHALEAPRNVTEPSLVCEPDCGLLSKTKEVFSSVSSCFDWPSFYSARCIGSKKDTSFKYSCCCSSPNSIRSGRGPSSQNPPKIKCMVCNQMFTCKNR